MFKFFLFILFIVIGLVNLCLTLYSSKEIEVNDTLASINNAEVSDNKLSRSTTYDHGLFSLNSEPDRRDTSSSNFKAYNTASIRSGQSHGFSGGQDSDTEDEADELELV